MLAQPRKIQVFESCLLSHMAREAEELDRPSSTFIRMRQIIEHNQLTKSSRNPRDSYMLSLLKRVWFAKVFESILGSFEAEYYESKAQIQGVRYKVAYRYLYELFQMNEFVKEGYRRLSMEEEAARCLPGDLLRDSDEALFESLESITTKKQFNQRDDMLEEHSLIQDYCKYKYDLLKSFPAKSMEFGVFANRDYLYEDLTYIIGKAEEQFVRFQEDMRELFGSQVSCRLKIRREANNSYNLNGVRKLLSRWLVNLITNDKEVIQSKAYQAFYHNKRKVLDLFYINSTVHSRSAQEKIVEIMLELLTNSVYEGSHINMEFGLYIYDLLKAKITVKTIRHIDHLLEKIQTSHPSNNSIEVFRVENRLIKHHRDVLVNLKYGCFVTAEVQILLAFSGAEQDVLKKKRQFEHKKFLYNLSRSVFGPTLELVILYEAERRQDDAARMYSIGRVTKRTDPIPGIDFTELFCPSKHRLLRVNRESSHLTLSDELCRSCFLLVRSVDLLLCHQCSIVYCERCIREFQGRGTKMIQRKKSTVRQLNDLNGVESLSGCSLVMLHLPYSPASILMQGYLEAIDENLRHPQLVFYAADVLTNKFAAELAAKHDIRRFPAFLLFRNCATIKVLIGASIYRLFDLIAPGQVEQHRRRCPQGHELTEIRPSLHLVWRCNECEQERGGTESVVLYCKQCRYYSCLRCNSASTRLECVFDDRGISYLSTAMIRDHYNYCANSHKMTLVHHNPFAKAEYECQRCLNYFFFLEQFGMYWCHHCLSMLCNSCSDEESTNLLHTKELANHELSRYMMDNPMCTLCRRHYKIKSQLDPEEFWCCDNCHKELMPGRQFLECENCLVRVCEHCFDKLKDDILSKNFLQDMLCRCSSKLQLATQLKHTHSRLFGCAVCRETYYYNTLHYQCSNYGECLFVMCGDCAAKTRIHVKVHCFKQSFSQQSKVRSFNLNIPRQFFLRQLKKLMEEQGLISKGCTGRFKTKEGWFSSNITEDTQLQEFGEQAELYYFESYDILDLTRAVDIFQKSETLKKKKERKTSGQSFNKMQTTRPGEQNSPNLLQVPPPELSGRYSRTDENGYYRTLHLPTLEDQSSSKRECCKARQCSLM